MIKYILTAAAAACLSMFALSPAEAQWDDDPLPCDTAGLDGGCTGPSTDTVTVTGMRIIRGDGSVVFDDLIFGFGLLDAPLMGHAGCNDWPALNQNNLLDGKARCDFVLTHNYNENRPANCVDTGSVVAGSQGGNAVAETCEVHTPHNGSCKLYGRNVADGNNWYLLSDRNC